MQKKPTVIEVVAAALINAQGQVLLQRRRADRAHGGLWEFPGGKVEPRESDLEALQREVAEELGLVLDSDAIVYLAEAADADTGLVIRLYSCRCWRGEAAALDADALQWCDPGSLGQLAMPPLDVPLAAAVKEMLESTH